MHTLSWLLLLLAANHAHHYRLPASARITVGHPENIAKRGISSGDPDLDCSREGLTQAQVRKQFASFHRITFSDIHDLYLVAECSVDGTVTLYGRSFRWSSNDGGWMSTTYPDGVEKLLGGAPTGLAE